MIDVSNIKIWGFEAAVRGMRNPMNSWGKSDSGVGLVETCPKSQLERCNEPSCDGCTNARKQFVVGPNDLDLMERLFDAGSEHRKYLRMIHVTMDITAPLYWWKEFDTYKVGTVANSCSTMHKIADKPFKLSNFSHEHLNDEDMVLLQRIVEWLNISRDAYNSDSTNKSYWWQMIQLLPSSYNQKRTVDFNYETLFSIIQQRTGHKLDEWNEFVEILKRLPYVLEIGGYDEACKLSDVQDDPQNVTESV